MSRFTFTKYGQWWNAPDEERFHAYYMNLRTNYGMPALEAFTYAKQRFARHPAFMTDPAGSIRQAIQGGRA